MKHNYFFRKTLLAVALLLGGASFSWADGTINIPQNVGSYITLGTSSGTNGDVATGVNLSNCKVDNSNTRTVSETTNYYTIGNTGSNSVATFTINVASTGDYIFNFKTGAGNCSAVLALSLKNSSSTEVWSSTTNVEQTRDAWALGCGHYFKINISEAGTYTMSVSVTSNTGSYAGNWGDFAFNSADAFDSATWPTSSSMITLSDGIYGGGCSGTDDIGSIRAGACAEYIVKNSTADTYLLHMGITYYGEGQLTLRITDMSTGTVDVEQVFDLPNISNYADFSFPIVSSLSTGVKQVRFAFSGTGNASSYIINYKNVYFESYTAASRYDKWPQVSATPTYLTLNQTFVSGRTDYPRYQSENSNLGYIYLNDYADWFVVNNTNEEAYYSFLAGVRRNVTSPKIKLTIYDFATNTAEVEETFTIPDEVSTSEYTTCRFNITNPIKTGLKKIRFNFLRDESTEDWLFNFNNVTFYKRSMNEDYDYTPVAAENVDVVLTRSIAAGKWATLVLPFAMTAEQITSAFGSGSLVAQLSSFTDSKIKFTTVSSMNAHEPYLIKVASNFSSATINGVTITAGTPNKTTVSGVDFIGSYNALTNIPFSDGTTSYYFLSGNTLYRSSTGTTHDTMKGFRAYFKVPGTASSRGLTFDVNDEQGGTTGVNEELRIKNEGSSNAPVYNLNGQRISHPSKGLYIVNGKKVIIK